MTNAPYQVETISHELLDEVVGTMIREAQPPMSRRDARKLREAMSTVKRVVTGITWWDPETEVGCPVGTVLHGPPSGSVFWSERRRQSWTEVGIKWTTTLGNATGHQELAPILRVTNGPD